MRCWACGHEFAGGNVACAHCPLARHCTVVCCPRCGCENLDESRSVAARWLGRIAARRNGARGAPGPEPESLPEGRS